MTEALTDGRTDTQSFGGHNIIPSSLFCGGGADILFVLRFYSPVNPIGSC